MAGEKKWKTRTLALRTDRNDKRPSKVSLRVMPPDVDGDQLPRPRTYDECRGGHRPCPIVSCPRNLYLDVTDSGSIRFNFPDRDPWDMPPDKSCQSDIVEASDGDMTLDDIGKLFHVTRERARQIEVRALLRLLQRLYDRGFDRDEVREYLEGLSDERKEP